MAPGPFPEDAILALHYNYTGKLHPGRYRGGLRPHTLLFLLGCCLIVAENLVVLVTIWKTKKLHSPMFYLLGNLTLSDLLAGVAYTANIVLSGANTLRLTPALWFLREGGVFLTLAASVLSLLAIAVERHLTMARVRVVSAASSTTKGRTWRLVATSWGLAVALAALPGLGWNCLGDLRVCSTVLPLYSKRYVFFCVAIFLAILLAIVILYARLYRAVRRSANLRPAPKSPALLKTVTVVVGTFIACWSPLFLLLLLDAWCCPRACAVLYHADYFLGLAMANSLLNPLIYTGTSREMCRAVLRLRYVFFCVAIFLAILLAIVILYARLYRAVRRSANLRPAPKSPALLKTVTVVVGTFIACWSPLFLLLLLDAWCCPRACAVLYHADYFLGLAMANSLLNPLIYTGTRPSLTLAMANSLLNLLVQGLQGGPGP
ncbi:PREDICTED: sphingosine 1-phosphate receptor 1-like [Calidris pugnax]|uniref:sphingosine 1-phosphate receptor 1-like n=1 Tax=Calidris pugnax TaxID=198806 RepID=UPI00071C5943|nr:PREDICTED: sphingosine 1-phosphate receptor 1-like [Calidris pugnax]